VGVPNFFLSESIGIVESNTFLYEDNTFQLKLLYSSIKTVGSIVLSGLWALVWAPT